VFALWLLVGLLLLTGRAHAADTSKAVIGTTPAQIHTRFASVIYSNLNNGSAAARLARLSNKEMQDLALAYERNTGVVNDLTALIRVRAPAQLARFAPMANNAVAGYTKTSPYYAAKIALRPAAGVVPSAPAPTLDMTLEEIYLEFRTAPVGALSVEASVYSTASYAMINLTAAWTAGYIIGSGVHWLIETYAPEWDNKIGSTLDGLLTGLASSTVALQGWWNYQLDLQVLDVSVWDLGYGTGEFGDFGLFTDMTSFMFDFNQCINPGYC
jgi:hypothetical protein